MEYQLVKATKNTVVMQYSASLMMNLFLITTLITHGLAFPTEKMLDIDEMPCHPEALEVIKDIIFHF